MKLKYVPGGICAPTGFTAGATHCGVRPNKKKNDLAIILSIPPIASKPHRCSWIWRPAAAGTAAPSA